MPIVIPPKSAPTKAKTMDDVIQAWCNGIYEYQKALEEQRARGNVQRKAKGDTP